MQSRNTLRKKRLVIHKHILCIGSCTLYTRPCIVYSGITPCNLVYNN